MSRGTARPGCARRRILRSVAGPIVCGLLVLAGVGRVSAEPVSDKDLQARLFPLVQRLCVDCHSQADAEADVNLEPFASREDMLGHRKMWQGALERIRKGQMPPEGSEMPTKAERDQMMALIHQAVNVLECEGPPRPGSVTIRRLNRAEYRNTIRDLLGIDYEQAADFPGDDVGYGFDNIGDVLSVPPILLEKYLHAAEQISDRAIIVPSQEGPQVGQWSGKQLADAKSSDLGQHTLASHAIIGTTITFPRPGTYVLKIRAWGDQAGPEPAKMRVLLENKPPTTFDVPNEAEKPVDYLYEIKSIAPGTRKLTIEFTNDFYDPKAKNRRRRDRNLHVESATVFGPAGALPEQLPPSHKKLLFITPEEANGVEAATQQILRRLASRSFRRPVTEPELARLCALARLGRQEEGSLEAGVRLALQAILVSPHFLYLVEQGVPGSEGRGLNGLMAQDLTQFEVATRLSYFLWSSMPDDQLLWLALKGELTASGRLESEVRRMLQDDRADAFVDNFAMQWLGLRMLETTSIDKKTFSQFSPELRADMAAETRRFLSEIIRKDRPVTDLLAADYSYLNERLAKHYGVEGIRGDEFRYVKVDKSGRGGLLTQASILTITSNPNRTSPVKRGKWIMENLLNSPPPPADPDAPPLEDQAELKGTLRERMEQHRANPACASCHAVMDQLGFALERFDAIGAGRTRDEGKPIDPSGKLPTGEAFAGPKELQKVLVTDKRDQFLACVEEKLLTYALGRGIEYFDQCTLDAIRVKVGPDPTFTAIICAAVRSEPFLKRQKPEVLP